MKRAVFLDRDGVLNHSILLDGIPKPPSSIEDVEIHDGVVEAIQILRKHDYLPVVVTNQPDIARGVATKAQIEEINSFVGAVTNIMHFYTCFHDDKDFCNCRKPSPGLIYLAAIELDICVEDSYMVGDRWRDVSAGQLAGCKTYFIDHGYAETKPEMPYIKVSSLLEAVNLMVGEHHETK
jgi:D-glycero-D-manno-heptose 1,7-bisphosphate phosphatase